MPTHSGVAVSLGLGLLPILLPMGPALHHDAEGDTSVCLRRLAGREKALVARKAPVPLFCVSCNILTEDLKMVARIESLDTRQRRRKQKKQRNKRPSSD